MADDELPTDLEKPATVRSLPGLARRAEAAKAGVSRIFEVKTDEDFTALAPGSVFHDPEGKQRTKPYIVTGDDDLWKVPEGAQFLDPEGQLRTRPRFEGVSVTTQTLYDMAGNDRERRKVLERGYPGGEVKQGPEGLYVEDKGGMFKPGRGLGAAVGHTLAQAAPIGGMLIGSAVGGAGGLA